MRSAPRLAGWVAGILLIVGIAVLTGCGGGGGGTPAVSVASITVSPAVASLNFGDTLQFSATAFNSNKQPVSPTFTFVSNSPGVVGMSPSGLACGGHWDSSFVNCTPGPVGVGQIVATAGGVTSPPVKVYVHQKVDSVSISPSSVNCLSKGGQQTFTATAINNVLGDITSTVGQFSWQAVDANVALLNNAVNGLGLNQAVATANAPGKTGVFALISGVNSVPSLFETCPVVSLSLTLNNVSGQTSIVLGTSGTATANATVTDSLGAVIAPSLVFSSTNPRVAAVGPTGFIGAANPGVTTIIASCTPPTCNTNLNPAYPGNVLTVSVTGAAANFNVWATSNGCNGKSGCNTSAVPISTPANSTGTAVTLPAVPNSMLFDPLGQKGYLGSDSGLMVLDTTTTSPTVTIHSSVPGKVLAISNDGTKVLISNTTVVPSDTFVFNASTSTATALGVGGITAGDFSADGLKVFLANGVLPSQPSPNLTIYSPLFAQANIALNAGSNPLGVTSFPSGAFAYIAGGLPSPNPVAVRATCDTSFSQDFVDNIATPGTPVLIRSLPNGTAILAVDPPNMDVITPTLGTSTACPPTVTDTAASYAITTGTITPVQMLVASDSSKAYVLTKEIPGLLVFDVASHAASTIPLAGGAFPITAIMRPDNTNLYVAATDGKVHQIRVATQADTGQIGGLSICSTGGCGPNILGFQP